MPSGIDAALAKMATDLGPIKQKVNLNGFEGMDQGPKKPTVSACTIDAAEEGMEKCQMILKEQERKIKNLKTKMDDMPPTKKNKPEINKLKEQIEVLQHDGNYRAALVYVRKKEQEETDKRREQREKAEEEAAIESGAGLKKKGAPAAAAAAASAAAASKKKEAAPKPAAEDGPFDPDMEVVGVVRSAMEGSEGAQEKLSAGAGTIAYTTEVQAEVASIVHGCQDVLAAKLKRAASRDMGLKTIRALLWNPPAVLPCLPAVLIMLDEAKVKLQASSLCEELCKCGPTGKAVPELVLPVLIAHLGSAAAGKWQVKIGTMNILKTVLRTLLGPDGCPKQLGWTMPKVMAALRDAAGDARKEVRREAEAFLRYMGQEMAGTPEVRNMVDEIVGSIVDSANMDKAAETLLRLANTTFLNAMDSCSFGLLYPIVSRAMRERAHEAKTRGVQIMGASVDLIADPEYLAPYINELMPVLKECLMHPTHGVQRESARSFGCLARGLPALCEEEIYPFLLDKLESTDVNPDVSEVDRRGAAMGLSEVLLKRRDLLPICIVNTLLPRISSGKTEEAKAGGLAVFHFLPHDNPQAFLPHLGTCLPAILNALQEESEVVTKHATQAVRVLIEEYGSTYPRLLLPLMQEALFFERDESRDLAMQLFSYLCEKLAEVLNFGQDFLSMEVLPMWYKQSLLSSIFIARTDPDHQVRRQATQLWNDRVQSQKKAKLEILEHLLQVLKGLSSSDKPMRQASAKACIADLTASGDANAEDVSKAEPLAAVQEAPSKEFEPGEAAAPPPPRGQLLQQRAQSELQGAKLPAPLRTYIEAVFVSSCVEASTKAAAVASLESELRPVTDKKAYEAKGSCLAAFGLQDMLDRVFEDVADEKQASTVGESGKSDALIRVDNLMMMYGGGHVLLKNSTLELCKGRRYGVVGRNGAGKTTLMSTIANGGVSQISKSVKTLHVRPEVLIEASDLTAVQFCQRDAPAGAEASAASLEAALQTVGFPLEMQAKAVNELSGGWRMKLLLASAMMRHCDVLLLDEPTNHLDTGSVEWLSQYLCSLENTTVMVISHNPLFLNVVCTDIIQYTNDRKLEYHRGNFNDFRKALNITADEEAEALLLGQDYDPDEKARAASGAAVASTASELPEAAGAREDRGPEDEEEVQALTAGLLDKQSKITFPIPGKLQGHTTAKAVVELKHVSFAYDEETGPVILQGVTCKITLNSRVGIVGKNGAGKSTLLNLICGETSPSQGLKDVPPGDISRHRNLRLAYIAQEHVFHLAEFFNSPPYVYMQKRYEQGWDAALQKRLMEPRNEEDAARRKELASKMGKYGNQVAEIVGRTIKGNEVFYEVRWETLDDPKSNSLEPFSKLKAMNVASMARAYDERLAAQAAGIDQRPLSQREIVKHLEQFGLNEDQVMNQLIGTFSAGQKSKLTLGASFWTKPHVVALDEPTNYIDMETLDALAKGLGRFKGGVVVISHSGEFVDRVCNEKWLIEGQNIKEVIKQEIKS